MTTFIRSLRITRRWLPSFIALGFALLCSTEIIQAQTVEVVLSTSTTGPVDPGETLSFEIVVTYDEPDGVVPNVLVGGAAQVGFDPALLEIVSAEVNPAISDLADRNTFRDGTGAAGELVLGFATFSSDEADDTFIMATIEFSALATGSPEVTIGAAQNEPVFFWSNSLAQAVNPTFSTVTAPVSVPIPWPSLLALGACIFLFGLLLLRRRII